MTMFHASWLRCTSLHMLALLAQCRKLPTQLTMKQAMNYVATLRATDVSTPSRQCKGVSCMAVPAAAAAAPSVYGSEAAAAAQQ